MSYIREANLGYVKTARMFCDEIIKNCKALDEKENRDKVTLFSGETIDKYAGKQTIR